MKSYKEYLNSLNDKSVWVFTKQETDFDISISATKLFSDIPDLEHANIETYFSEHHSDYNIETDRHRMLVIPQLFGLITKTPFYKKGYQYNKERPTAVFDNFKKLFSDSSNSDEKIIDMKKYNTLKTEQILKLKIHAIIDTANNNTDYYVLPVIFIYKVLRDLKTRYKINEISINQLYTYVMTCKNYSELEKAVQYIKDNCPVSKYVNKYKGNSRVLTCIKKNINLFNITSNKISLNDKFDNYFYNNFFIKYDIEEMMEILKRDVDYSYFLYNTQDFNVNLVDEPSLEYKKSDETIKEVIKVESGENEVDDDYENKVDGIDENNVNRDVAIGAYAVAPSIEDSTKISKKYKRNPLLGKIAIQNAYYCCERNARHETFISAKTNKNFMEAHHLVPVMFQKEIWNKYNINVDCVENILSLCPTCHRAFHNGTKKVKSEMIEVMYEKLLPRYKSIGFNITVEEIKQLYKVL